MPQQFDECVAVLTAQGCSRDHACRACETAFWQEHGVTVGTALADGFDPSGESLADHAGVVAAELAAGGEDESTAFVACGPLRDLTEEACLSYAPGTAYQSDGKSLMKECDVLQPGQYNGFSFAAEDLRDYARNFDAGDPPPIIKDHNLADADNSHGFVRGLRFDEPTQTLMALSEFLGAHAVERVTDKRWKKLSGRFIISKAPERRRMTELSVTLKPAFTGSRIGSKKKEVAQMPKEEAKLSQAAEQKGKDAPSPADSQKEALLADREAAIADREAALAADKAEFTAKLAEQDKQATLRRQREDQKDWELLLHQGFTVPHIKEAELAFMGRLSDDDKEAYLALRQSDNKKIEFGRKSVPDKTAKTEDTAVTLADDKARQEVMLAAGRQAMGLHANGQAAKEGSK